MTSEKIKEYLLQIAGNVKEETKLDDICEQPALLNDIDESEEDEKRENIMTHEEVISKINV